MAETKSTKSGFSAEERAAMKERAKELKANASRAESEKALLEKIAEMSGRDRALAEKLHKIVTEVAPQLVPKTWYGMPAYFDEKKAVVFFQAADKFDARYATVGFNDVATLDDGDMWATSFAVTKIGSAEEKKITDLVKKATS